MRELTDRVHLLGQVPATGWLDQQAFIVTCACPWDENREKGIEYVVLAADHVKFRVHCELWRGALPWQVNSKAAFLEHLLWDAEDQLVGARYRLMAHKRHEAQKAGATRPSA